MLEALGMGVGAVVANAVWVALGDVVGGMEEGLCVALNWGSGLSARAMGLKYLLLLVTRDCVFYSILTDLGKIWYISQQSIQATIMPLPMLEQCVFGLAGHDRQVFKRGF
jgi:hypothetical protein